MCRARVAVLTLCTIQGTECAALPALCVKMKEEQKLQYQTNSSHSQLAAALDPICSGIGVRGEFWGFLRKGLGSAPLRGLGSQLSALWLQVIPNSQDQPQNAPCGSQICPMGLLGAIWGYPFQHVPLLAPRRCHDCLTETNILNSPWLSTSSSSCEAFT